MRNISQGLKAGLAGGVIYGALIGLLHVALLDACSATQVPFILQNLIGVPTRTRMISFYDSQTAFDIFGNDLIQFALYWGIAGLIAGVIYGALFPSAYSFLPGHTSRRKGTSMGIIVYVVGIFFDLSGLEINCSPGFIPVLFMLASLPASLAFGYFLGLFYDSFGRHSKEQQMLAEKAAPIEKGNNS